MFAPLATPSARVLGLILVALWCVLPRAASAQEFSTLESVLLDISWGDSQKTTLKKLEGQMYAALLKKDELKNAPIKMQQARARVREEFAKVGKSAITFKGTQTGYEVSIIAAEFTPDNNESMVVSRDDFAERYYFFIDDKLYKMVIAYNKKYIEGSDFESFAVQMARKYGRPIATDYGDVLGEEQLIEVTWESDATQMKIFNKTELFGTFTVAFSDVKRVRSLKASNRMCCGDKKKDDRRERALSAEVADLTTEDASKTGANAVTDMVGDVDIDFSLGRPDDEPLRPSEQKKLAEKGKETSKSSKNNRKSRKSSKRRKSKKGGLKAKKGSKALIIY